MLSIASASPEGEPAGLAQPFWAVLLLSAAESAVHWPRLLEHLTHSLGYRQAVLVATSDGFRDPVPICFHGDQVHHLLDRDPPRRALEGRPARPGDLFLTHDLVADEVLLQDSFYQRNLAPRDWHYGFWLTLLAEDGNEVHLTMRRSRASGPSTVRQLDPLLRHLTALQLAVRMGAEQDRLLAEHAALARAADRLAHGYVLLTRDQRVTFANKQARRILDGRGVLRMDGQDLKASEPVVQRQVTDFLMQSLNRVQLDGHPQILRLRAPDGTASLWLHPERLDARMTCGKRRGSEIALVLVTSEAGTPPRTELLESLFHLTPAEARVAAMVGSGLTLAETAECSGTKSYTVKSQLGQVYKKLGLKRQSELVMLLMRLSGL